MKFNKIFIYIVLFMISLIGINANINDDLTYGSHFNNSNADDWSGNGNDGIVVRASITTDKNNIANQALLFDGIDDWVDTIDFAWSSNDFTINMWYYLDSTWTGSNPILFRHEGTDFIAINTVGTTARPFKWTIVGAGGTLDRTTSTLVNTNVWCMISMTRVGNVFTLYKDGIEIDTETIAMGIINPTNTGRIGATATGAAEWKGKFDEPRIWYRGLDSSEILEEFNLYDEEESDIINPILTFTNITSNNITLINNTFYNSSINFETEVLNISTNDLVNQSYSLNGGSFIQYATNNLIGTVDLNLIEGYYNISFCAENNETNVCSINYSILVDKTKPNIQVLQNLTTDNFFINFSNAINVTDNLSGLESCTINITYLEAIESDSNFLINCTDTQLFTRAGLYNGFVTAKDYAGNIQILDANGTITPYDLIYFTKPNNEIIINYSATIYHPDGRILPAEFYNSTHIKLKPINNGTLDLGNHTIAFEKFGLEKTNFTYLIDDTTGGDINSFEVLVIATYLNIRDRSTKVLITQLINFDIVGDQYSASYSTTTGLKTITDFNELPGVYRISFESEDYASNEYYFQHTGFDIINITTYLINTTQSLPIKISLIDIFSSAMKWEDENGDDQGCLIKVKQYFIDNNDYIVVDMGITNTIGEIIFDLEYNKYYQFVIECDEDIQTEPGQKITTTPITIVFDANEELTIFDELPNLAGKVTFDNLSNTTGYFRFEYNDQNNIATQGCLNVYEIKYSGNILINSSCTNSPSATINVNLDFTTNKKYLGQGYITYEGKEHFIHEYIKSFLPDSSAWAKGMGIWSAFLLIGIMFLIGAGKHPIAGIGFAWLGTFISVLIGALALGEATITGLGIFILGIILIRRSSP